MKEQSNKTEPCPKCGKPMVRFRDFLWPDGTTGQIVDHEFELDKFGKRKMVPACSIAKADKPSDSVAPFVGRVVQPKSEA